MRPLSVSVTYHEACHLAHAQRIRTEPRNMLRGIPGLRLVETDGVGRLAAGGAGIYNLLQPGMAGRTLDAERWRGSERRTTTSWRRAILAVCYRSSLGLRQVGVEGPSTVHPIELVDWRSMSNARGESREGIQGNSVNADAVR